MVEIEFSVMVGIPGTSNHLLPLMEAFEKHYRVHVNLLEISWTKGWTEIVKFGDGSQGCEITGVI